MKFRKLVSFDISITALLQVVITRRNLTMPPTGYPIRPVVITHSLSNLPSHSISARQVAPLRLRLVVFLLSLLYINSDSTPEPQPRLSRAQARF